MIIEQLKHEYKKQRKILSIVYFVLVAWFIFLIVMTIFSLLNGAKMESLLGTILLSIVISVFLIKPLSTHHLKTKIVLKHALPDIIDSLRINYPNLVYTYKYKKKIPEENSNLFTVNRRWDTNYYHIQGNDFDLFATRLLQKRGRYTGVIFKGLLYKIKSNFSSMVQIRSKGKPVSNNDKYDLIEKQTDFTYFAIGETKVNKTYINIYEYLLKKYQLKRLEMSFTNDYLYIAMSPKSYKLPKMNKFTTSEYNKTKDYLTQKIEIISTIQNMLNST